MEIKNRYKSLKNCMLLKNGSILKYVLKLPRLTFLLVTRCFFPRHSLLVVFLLVTCYFLPVTHCFLLVTRYSLFYSLLVTFTRYSLLITRCFFYLVTRYSFFLLTSYSLLIVFLLASRHFLLVTHFVYLIPITFLLITHCFFTHYILLFICHLLNFSVL